MFTSEPTRHANGSDQRLQFSALPEKLFFRVSEVAALLNLGSTKIEEMFAERCHRYPAGTTAKKRREQRQRLAAAADSARAQRTRPAMRIPRTFVVQAIVESASYSSDDLRESVASCFRHFGAADLVALRARLDAQLRRNSQ